MTKICKTCCQNKMFFTGILIAAVITSLDQAHKLYMVEVFDISNNQFHVTSFFDMVMVWNQGISFGMLQNPENGAYIFASLSLVICIILLIWLKRNKNTLIMWAIGLIIGGAIGNVIDRLHYGAVADFFYFHIGQYGWPAFNIADIAVFLGAVIICFESIFLQDKGKDNEQNQ